MSRTGVGSVTISDIKDGDKTLSSLVYYQLTSANAPTKPTADFYDFTAGELVNLSNNWGLVPPTYAAQNGNKYWLSYLYADSSGVLTFQNPKQATSFAGLVTFDGTTFSNGTNTFNSTSIDGAHITTGKIVAARLDIDDIFAQEITATSTISAVNSDVQVSISADNDFALEIATIGDVARRTVFGIRSDGTGQLDGVILNDGSVGANALGASAIEFIRNSLALPQPLAGGVRDEFYVWGASFQGNRVLLTEFQHGNNPISLQSYITATVSASDGQPSAAQRSLTVTFQNRLTGGSWSNIMAPVTLTVNMVFKNGRWEGRLGSKVSAPIDYNPPAGEYEFRINFSNVGSVFSATYSSSFQVNEEASGGATATGNANDSVITLNGTGGLTGGGAFSLNQANNETITITHGSSAKNGSLGGTGLQVLQTVGQDTYGHLKDVTTVNLATEFVKHYTKIEADARYFVIRGSIGGGLDLNNYIESGVYLQQGNAGATSGTNYPTNLAGTLTVKAVTSTYVTQVYEVYDGRGTYWRTRYQSAWNAWKRVVDTESLTKGLIDALNIDADTLDGLHVDSLVRKDTPEQLVHKLRITSTTTAIQYGSGQLELRTLDGTPPLLGFHKGGVSAAVLYESSNQLYIASNGSTVGGMIWHQNNDGAGSGLDADTLDGIHGSAFGRKELAQDWQGIQSFNDGINVNGRLRLGNDSKILTLTISSPSANFGGGRTFIRLAQNNLSRFYSGRFTISSTWNFAPAFGILEREFGVFVPSGATAIHSNSASRISAATGNSADNLRIGAPEIVNGWFGFYVYSANTNSIIVRLDLVDSGDRVSSLSHTPWETSSLPSMQKVDFEDLTIDGNRVWHQGNDGAGSGLDADLLDGVNSTSFLRSDVTDYLNSTLFVQSNVVVPSAFRHRGIFGTYDATKTQHIWSMGTAYTNSSDGSDFGNLYGLGYYHPNNGTHGALAGGHQTVHVMNGAPTSALGSNIWTSGALLGASADVGSGGISTTGIITAGNVVRINTPTWEGTLGSTNSGFFHIITDRPLFYMNKRLEGAEGFKVYNSNNSLTSIGLVAALVTSAADVTAGNDVNANGAYYKGDGKRIIQFSDSWLRINPNSEFSSGIYCASSILRTDGELHVGSSGNKFKVTAGGTVTCAGNIQATGAVLATYFQATSALKYKDIDYRESTSESLSKVCAIGNKGVAVGTFKDGRSDKTHRWFIADEVNEVMPEVVGKVNGEVESLNYNEMLADAYAAIAELTERVKSLEEKLNG